MKITIGATMNKFRKQDRANLIAQKDIEILPCAHRTGNADWVVQLMLRNEDDQRAEIQMTIEQAKSLRDRLESILKDK